MTESTHRQIDYIIILANQLDIDIGERLGIKMRSNKRDRFNDIRNALTMEEASDLIDELKREELAT